MSDLSIVQLVITNVDREATSSNTCIVMTDLVDTCMDVDCVVNVLPLKATVFVTLIKFMLS